MERDWKGGSYTGRDKGTAVLVVVLAGPHPYTGKTWGNSVYTEYSYLKVLLKGLN